MEITIISTLLNAGFRFPMIKTAFILFMVALPLSCSSQPIDYNWVDVTNVNAGDTLSVRSQPDAKSEMLGELRYNQVGIKVTEKAPRGDSSNWIPIQSGSLAGWVNLHYVKPTKLASFAEPLKCLGTEPFWSLDSSNGQTAFSSMGDKASTYAIVNISQSQNQTNAWLFHFTDGANQRRIVLKKTGQCSDNMSDRLYDYELGFELPEGRYLTGCCNSR